MSVFAAGIWCFFGSNGGRLQVDAGSPSGQTQGNLATNSQEVLHTDQSGRSIAAGNQIARNARINAASQTEPESSTLHSSEAGQNSNANSQAFTSKLESLSIPEGAAFPVSGSIEAECVRREKRKIGCVDERKVLKKFEEEKIDSHWAPFMERRLRAAYGQDPGIRIRALACRSSVCAVESEGSNVLSPIWGPLSDDLFPEGDIRAYEHVDNGRAILGVSLMLFTRER
jgi:hypothetical protein